MVFVADDAQRAAGLRVWRSRDVCITSAIADSRRMDARQSHSACPRTGRRAVVFEKAAGEKCATLAWKVLARRWHHTITRAFVPVVTKGPCPKIGRLRRLSGVSA